MLQGAIDEAILAVDLYNQPRSPRRLEGFFVHMHIAWLYLLQAELRRNNIDYRYRLANGRFDKIDGEPKTWDLQRCAKERWDSNEPVRKNLELSIGLRNKIEHRYHEATTVITSGYAQALLINFEAELTDKFGTSFSLGEVLRFPIFVGSVTPLGKGQFDALRAKLPRDTRDYIARFESDLGPGIAEDQRYEFRINLVPKLGAKTDADASLTFVREDELTGAQKKHLASIGNSGQVIIREQTRPVASGDKFKPTTVADMVEARVPFRVRTHHVVRAWKRMACRPPYGDAHPERTTERYCVYDVPHRDYLYTQAFVDKLVRELSTAEKFEMFTDLRPEAK